MAAGAGQPSAPPAAGGVSMTTVFVCESIQPAALPMPRTSAAPARPRSRAKRRRTRLSGHVLRVAAPRASVGRSRILRCHPTSLSRMTTMFHVEACPATTRLRTTSRRETRPGPTPRARPFPPSALRPPARERQREHRPPGPRLDFDRAAHQHGQLARDRQTQPAARAYARPPHGRSARTPARRGPPGYPAPRPRRRGSRDRRRRGLAGVRGFPEACARSRSPPGGVRSGPPVRDRPRRARRCRPATSSG